MTTSTLSKLPNTETLAETFAMLFGEEVEDVNVRPARKLEVERTAFYGTDEENVTAALECDRAFAVFAAAKLVMVPAGRAKELAGSDEPNASIDEAFHEIANIAATWFQQGREERTSLLGVETGDASRLTDVAGKEVFAVDVSGYGTGIVRLLNANS